MTATEARDAIKSRLGIASAEITWDTLIDGLVTASVKRLYPRASLEVASQEVTSFSVTNLGECVIDMTTLTGTPLALREVEVYDGYAWARISDTKHHGNTCRLRGIDDSITKIRVYGIKNFASITDVYEWLTQSVIWYAMAEFYDYLAGNQRDYNTYMQSSGARAVDNMADQSAYYDSKADRYLDEQAQQYGV